MQPRVVVLRYDVGFETVILVLKFKGGPGPGPLPNDLDRVLPAVLLAWRQADRTGMKLGGRAASLGDVGGNAAWD